MKEKFSDRKGLCIFVVIIACACVAGISVGCGLNAGAHVFFAWAVKLPGQWGLLIMLGIGLLGLLGWQLQEARNRLRAKRDAALSAHGAVGALAGIFSTVLISSGTLTLMLLTAWERIRG
jgi:hypothetical protein